jgi:cytochrome c oxidase subunit II
VIALVVVGSVWWSTHRRGRVDREALAERERAWFVVVIGLLAILLFSTILFTPYVESSPADAQTVRVEGRQFAWTLTPSRLQAGRAVRFVVRARDVNHNFAVYNPAGTLLFQVQAVPESDTIVRYTFKRPGTYTILCLEFCGLGHAGMQGSFTVAA